MTGPFHRQRKLHSRRNSRLLRRGNSRHVRPHGARTSPFVFVKLVFETIGQRDPTGLDDVFTDTHGSPGIVLVATLNDNADPSSGTGVRVYNPDLVIDKVH